MELYQKITALEDGMVTIIGRTSSGKTLATINLVVGKLKQRKKVIYLSTESGCREFNKKISNIDELSIFDTSFIEYHSVRDLTNLKITLESINKGDVDLLVFEDLFFSTSEVDFKRLRNIGVSILLILNQGNKLSSVSLKEVQNSDFVLNINKTTFDFLTKLKYFFMFWKEKPNFKLSVIKNRHGKTENINVKSDFKGKSKLV